MKSKFTRLSPKLQRYFNLGYQKGFHAGCRIAFIIGFALGGLITGVVVFCALKGVL